MDKTTSNMTSPHGNGAELLVERSSQASACFQERNQSTVVSTGWGLSTAQHGELLQGQIEDACFQWHRCLVSLPCQLLYSQVRFAASHDEPLTVEPVHKSKSKKVVQLTLQKFNLERLGGKLTIDTNINEGKGYGSSTSDCVASALAAAAAIGQSLTEEELAKLVVAAEIASDNFMFKRVVLFAHREGRVLEDLAPRLPRLVVLGIDTDVDGAVYTLDFPPAVYTWRQKQCFRTLVSALRRAVRCGDVALLGRVATASAVINQQFLPKPMFCELRHLAEHAGAVGIAVAHSGTVLSMLFNPLDASLENRISRVQKELGTLGITRCLRFYT